jgi:hypothetical protein
MGEHTKSDTEYRNSPVVWFCILEQAKQQNDFERAAEAKRQLERLGVVVKYRRIVKPQGGTDGR